MSIQEYDSHLDKPFYTSEPGTTVSDKDKFFLEMLIQYGPSAVLEVDCPECPSEAKELCINRLSGKLLKAPCHKGRLKKWCNLHGISYLPFKR